MNLRAILLPLVALLAAVVLVAVHVASGGADFVPTAAADPCVPRPLPPPTEDLEALTETLVVDGVRRAACTLGVTRERLLLALPSERERLALARETGTDEPGLAQALRGGLDRALTRLDGGGRLPRASRLRDEYVDELDLPALAEEAVRRIPDGIVDELLPTAAVLRRALTELDVLAVVREIDAPEALERRLRDGIEAAARAEARDRLIARIPGPLRGLLGLG